MLQPRPSLESQAEAEADAVVEAAAPAAGAAEALAESQAEAQAEADGVVEAAAPAAAAADEAPAESQAEAQAEADAVVEAAAPAAAAAEAPAPAPAAAAAAAAAVVRGDRAPAPRQLVWTDHLCSSCGQLIGQFKLAPCAGGRDPPTWFMRSREADGRFPQNGPGFVRRLASLVNEADIHSWIERRAQCRCRRGA